MTKGPKDEPGSGVYLIIVLRGFLGRGVYSCGLFVQNALLCTRGKSAAHPHAFCSTKRLAIAGILGASKLESSTSGIP